MDRSAAITRPGPLCSFPTSKLPKATRLFACHVLVPMQDGKTASPYPSVQVSNPARKREAHRRCLRRPRPAATRQKVDRVGRRPWHSRLVRVVARLLAPCPAGRFRRLQRNAGLDSFVGQTPPHVMSRRGNALTAAPPPRDRAGFTKHHFRARRAPARGMRSEVQGRLAFCDDQSLPLASDAPHQRLCDP
jgi:hypothetical protein